MNDISLLDFLLENSLLLSSMSSLHMWVAFFILIDVFSHPKLLVITRRRVCSVCDANRSLSCMHLLWIWSSCTFILTQKKKNNSLTLLEFFTWILNTFQCWENFLSSVFIMPMNACRCLLVFPLILKKEIKKVYEGAYSFKYIKHSKYRQRHGVTALVYISAYKSRVFTVQACKAGSFQKY